MKSIVKKIYSHPFLNESRSILDIVIYRITLSVISAIYQIKYKSQLKNTEDFILKQKEIIKNKKKKVFVFANGPSMKEIDLHKVANLCEKEDYDLIAINSYLSNSADIAKPTYAVFADNVHFENPSGQYKNDINKCKNLGVTYFSPAKYIKNNVKNELMQGYCSICDIDSKNTANILKPAGYYGVTAFFALSLAKMLDYDEIYICGFDNSYFKDFEIDENGEMVIRHKHYYDKEESETKVRCLYSSTSQFFYDTYQHFSFLEKITNDTKFINLAKRTYLSNLSNTTPIDVYIEKTPTIKN